MKTAVFLAIILVLGGLILAGCDNLDSDNGDGEEPSGDECEVHTDCASAGCSGQICGPEEAVQDIMTTCEWKEEYECLRLTSCGCVNGGCGWLESEEYDECMRQFET